MEVLIRGAKPDDIAFVMSTWLRSLYHGSKSCSEIDRNDFFRGQSEIIRNTLLNPSNSLRIAFSKDDEGEVLLGYACLGWPLNESPILRWIYVKRAFRNVGIARQLLEGAQVKTVTTLTELGNEIRKKKNLKYNPFL